MPVPSEVETDKQQQQIIETAPIPSEVCSQDNGPVSPLGEGDSNGDNSACKLFVGGLNFDVDPGELEKLFEEYGTVQEVKVMKDPISNRPRGFAFVTFKTEDSVAKALNAHMAEPLTIKNRQIDPKKAVPHKKLSTNRVQQIKRIFIGGISSDSVEEDLKNYFSQFGQVVDCQLMFDRNTNRHRGFGFVSFGAEEPAEKVCSIQYHDIKGKKVEVKVAQTKEALAMATGKVRTTNGRNNYGYMCTGYGPTPPSHYYTGSPQYGPSEYMPMGGYPPAAPYLIGNGLRKQHPRGNKDYQYPPYMFQNWGDSRMTPGGYYGPAPGYHGMPIMLRGHPGMDPNMIIPNSGLDYMAEQFQSMTMGGYPPSPMNGPYPQMSHVPSGDGGSAGGSPQDLSPPPSSAVTTFNTQVPGFTGTGSFNNAPTVVGGANYN